MEGEGWRARAREMGAGGGRGGMAGPAVRAKERGGKEMMVRGER